MNKEKEKKSDEWVLIVNRTGEWQSNILMYKRFLLFSLGDCIQIRGRHWARQISFIWTVKYLKKKAFLFVLFSFFLDNVFEFCLAAIYNACREKLCLIDTLFNLGSIEKRKYVFN
jgi:hypothetical protein